MATPCIHEYAWTRAFRLEDVDRHALPNERWARRGRLAYSPGGCELVTSLLDVPAR